MRVFVTGGTGFVGSEFIQYLLKYHQQQYSEIVALSRSAAGDEFIRKAVGDQQSGVQIVRGDLSSVDILEKYLKDCSVVFHSAAKVDIWGVWEDFVQANVIGTQNLIEAAKTAGVKRFVHVSTEAVLVRGYKDGSLVNIDETAPLSLEPPFYAPYTKSKAMTEKLVLEANDPQKDFVTVAVRPRLVWGKGDTKILPAIEKAIQDGLFKWFTPDVQSSTCHVENLCEGMVLAAERGQGGQAYFLTDGEGPVVFNDFIRQLLDQQCDLSRVGSLSSSLAWYLSVFLENLPLLGYGVTREAPLNRQILALLTQDVILKDDKARRELGYTSHMSREQGIRDYLQWRADQAKAAQK